MGNPMRADPSRTGLIRAAYERDLANRFNQVRKNTLAWVNSNGLIINAPKFEFTTDPDKLKAFNRWLKDQIDRGILEINPATGEPRGQKPWMYKYIDSAYKKGMLRAYTDVDPKKFAKKPAWYGESREAFLQSSFGRPERMSAVRMLYTRAYEDLKGITAAMSTKISRALADGMAQGSGPLEVGRTISKTISGISRYRAVMIARTEIIHAHAEAQLDIFGELGVDKLGVEVEFSDAGDNLVCDECADLDGQIFTLDEARGVIPVHPNCRCCWTSNTTSLMNAVRAWKKKRA